MVEHRDTIGELGRVVVGQQKTAGGKPDLARLHQRLSDQEIGRGMRLPGCGVVLADPCLGKAEFVGPTQRLQIPAMAVEEAAFRRVRGHRKEAVMHRRSPGSRFPWWSYFRPLVARSHVVGCAPRVDVPMYQFVNEISSRPPFFCHKSGFPCASLTQLPPPGKRS